MAPKLNALSVITNGSFLNINIFFPVPLGNCFKKVKKCEIKDTRFNFFSDSFFHLKRNPVNFQRFK